MIELDRSIYFKDDTGISQKPRKIMFKEHPVFILMPITSTPISNLIVDQHLIATIDDESIEDVDSIALDVDIVVLDNMRIM